MGVKNRNIITGLLFILISIISMISPRYDIITMILHIVLVGLFWIVLSYVDKINERSMNKEIKEIISVIDQIGSDEPLIYPEDEFGILRDKIIKELNEKEKTISKLKEERIVLQSYVEDIHHQIKTPITGISLMIDLIENNPKESDKYIKIIRNDLDRLDKLTGVLLKMSYLDGGLYTLKEKKIGVYSMVLDTIHSLESFIHDKNIEIIGEDFYIIGDKEWISEALYNLIKNASEASGDMLVEVILEQNKIYKSIIVRDYTEGISLGHQPYIYDRFYKVDPESSGFGIGLSMVKSIMEKSGGEVIYTRYKEYNDFEMRFY